MEPLVHPLTVATPISGLATLKDVCRSCVLDIRGCMVVFDLIILDMTEFDVIVGMDWLSTFRARVDCHRRRITFRTLKGERFFFVGEGRVQLNPLPMRRMLANVWAEETDSKTVELPPVVRKFPNVFPKELPGMPPMREVEFTIDLLSGTTPIFTPPYRMASAELEEL